MAIKIPGKRYGKRLQKSKIFGEGAPGKKGIQADLNITPMVDMFVIIVLFLVANFSATGEILMMTKDIQLPEAANVQEVQMVPVIMVSDTDVVVDNASVGRTEDIVRDDMLNIQALEDKLREMKRRFEELHSQGGEEFKGEVNIQGHKEVKFNIIKKVMFTCSNAGYANINFAVMQVGGGKEGEAAPQAATP